MRPRFIFSTSPQLVWLLLIGLVLVALISAAVAGSRLFRSPELLPTSSRTTEVAAGWYFMPVDYTPERFAFDVPRGWSTSEGYVFKGGRQTILEYEVSFVTWGELTHVFGDLCDAGQLVSAGTSADELTSALARQNGREVTGPEQVTVDGRVGKVVHLLAASDLQCPWGGPRVWPDPGPDLTGGMLTSAGQMDDVYAFDSDQGRLVIVASFS
ncbi:MAG: hypothetical protein ACXWDE_12355, partial [Aeromicrobium sp.]